MRIKFKYERLPSFCFYCGIIGHTEKFCELLFDTTGETGNRKYDASLRATVRNQAQARRNQWLRSSDGGKLEAGETKTSSENGELNQSDQARSQDCSETQCA